MKKILYMTAVLADRTSPSEIDAVIKSKNFKKIDTAIDLGLTIEKAKEYTSFNYTLVAFEDSVAKENILWTWKPHNEAKPDTTKISAKDSEEKIKQDEKEKMFLEKEKISLLKKRLLEIRKELKDPQKYHLKVSFHTIFDHPVSKTASKIDEKIEKTLAQKDLTLASLKEAFSFIQEKAGNSITVTDTSGINKIFGTGRSETTASFHKQIKEDAEQALKIITPSP